MINRIKTALDKLRFCWNITADILSFISLVWLTKKYKWSKNNKTNSVRERSVKYAVHISRETQNIYLRTYSGDIDIFYEIFWNKIYSFPVNNSSCLIVDMGANIGLATLYFLNRFPQSKIICVEPDPGNIEMLKKNLELPIKQKNVVIAEIAITDKDGFMILSSPSLKYNSKLLQNKNDIGTKVKVLSMNTFLKEYLIKQIDILKIDIEGSEVELFSGDINWLSRVSEIIMETHSVNAEELCSHMLGNNGFILQNKFASVSHWAKA